MSTLSVKGSCLCGSVEYEVVGNIKRFSHCHCQRCRKATGTGHATNLIVSPQTSNTWLKGEDLLSKYKVPDAERFYNCFCKICGGPMPRIVPEIDAVLIPGGSLDTSISDVPEHRIFYDSRVEWSCSDDLPVYSEYPTEA